MPSDLRRRLHATTGHLSLRLEGDGVDKARENVLVKPPGMAGFTLVEVAIALAVMALLLGGLLVPLRMQVEQRKIRETQRAMDEIKEALVGYAIVNGYLPCPAISATIGNEDRTGTACSGGKRVGFIPWADLGVARSDAWGRLFRYSVTAKFSNSGTKFTFLDPGDITVRATTSSANSVASAIPAVVMSHGKNGYLGTTEENTLVANLSSTNSDEQANSPPAAGTVFVSKNLTENTAATGGEFDDLVAWVSPNILFNRMVAAGRLP